MAETPHSAATLSVQAGHDCGHKKTICDDGIADGMSYRRYNDSGSSDENDGLGWDEQACLPIRHKYGRRLGPFSPERAPGIWMLLNALLLSWSFALGMYGLLFFAWYGNDTLASRENTLDYLLWSLLTTLVWVVEISLRAAFPGVDTVLVVVTPTDDSATKNTGTIESPATTEESVVTLERTIQKRSNKHAAVIATELLLALFFVIATAMDCWKFWNHHYGGTDTALSNDTDSYDYKTYYGYEEATGGESSDDRYSMFEQQLDIWIGVLAYAYMTYTTYHEYKRATITKRDIQRSLSHTMLQYHQQRSSRSATTIDIAAPEATTLGTTQESSSSLLRDAEHQDYGVCRPTLVPAVRRNEQTDQ